MAYRSFRTADGIDWDAWDVNPGQVERRLADRRHEDAASETDVERRRHAERRSQFGRRSSLLGLEQGWLCFEHDGEKRRLTPIPSDWPRCDEARLIEYCAQARPVRRVSRPALVAPRHLPSAGSTVGMDGSFASGLDSTSAAPLEG